MTVSAHTLLPHEHKLLPGPRERRAKGVLVGDRYSDIAWGHLGPVGIKHREENFVVVLASVGPCCGEAIACPNDGAPKRI